VSDTRLTSTPLLFVVAYVVVVAVPVGVFCHWFANGWYAWAVSMVLSFMAGWFSDDVYGWFRR